MRILLGRDFDGHVWSDIVDSGKGSAADGEMAVGPLGFLSFLQEKLGLPDRSRHGSYRLAVWEKILRAEDREGAFHHRSFSHDAWGTTKLVLSLRDELKLFGALEGGADALKERAESAEAAGLGRLAALFRMELRTLEDRSLCAPGMPDTLRTIIGWLKRRPIRGLDEVVLCTPDGPEGCWEAPWLELFAELARHGVAFAESPECRLTPQDGLRNACILKVPTRALGAHALASFFAGSPDAVRGTVLIRPEAAPELDEAFASAGLGLARATPRSTARAFLQTILLFLHLHLTPFDP
ncbi:MAG: hypothetical protein MJ061_05950, partial [Mailhella sp.]|nr:hypothetical protein [Mailhella sp.]